MRRLCSCRISSLIASVEDGINIFSSVSAVVFRPDLVWKLFPILQPVCNFDLFFHAKKRSKKEKNIFGAVSACRRLIPFAVQREDAH